MTKRGVILISGGLDSSTVLAIVKAQGYETYGISFDYGQRHKAELQAVAAVAKNFALKEHKLIRLNLNEIGGSALTDSDIEVPKNALGEEIPVTYVPARNTIFLSIALGYAERVGASDIFIGVNAIDYSNYPDCRAEYLEAFEKLANLATKQGANEGNFKIHAPLMKMTKAEIITTGIGLGVDYSITHSCYSPNSAGVSCGECDACLLRLRGFKEAGIVDPIEYQ
ncbi:7-cyano-7-deazaguanine synthase QueC [Rickettsiales endosymbiont of Stachyamoeba lipophora]|uniref:7-cyano-7-deazaguanine synthase QueC n=1 Tax=Rickettsiales endosymbiont of Stachyamoeba lipophora TaxID=2486578 RepID=UPI000F6459CB|nr:7-cyano-7-deazaguanine synthase QueC [Rickettsiales endosymbiont of Stachyamoeba lipophora]AZL16118.1 7-cyano-7-deazaguanine synthase QueC [Rickettsiales endosymbiont of Stachyamoeba lipophora]